MIAPEVSTTDARLGPAAGTGHRHILFGTVTYNIIPIGWQGSTQRAYDEALASVSGANALADVTLEEDWFWWVVGSARTTVLTGQAVHRAETPK